MKTVYINDDYMYTIMNNILKEKKKKYKILTTKQFLNPDLCFVDFVYFTSVTPKRIKNEIYKKETQFSTPFRQNGINFTDKKILHDFIAKKDPTTFKKFSDISMY